MTDVYIEDPQDGQHGALEEFRADMGRLVHQLERRVQDSAADVAAETRFLMHRTQRRINAHLGVSALIALSVGLTLGLVAAVMSASRKPPA
ncbi:MAG: hypothetical protein JO261_13685 [Alphaproteobacteria bacterium]|nr:hypothetical protein [Alphaproteobacteria bacterium]MBV9694744.1 hypothetical protein [Alphaproteobacteria bacterium]